jgi:hypothetical protein
MIKSEIFPTIYNKKNYLVSEIPNYHPDSAKYLSWWRTQKKRIFEGCWIPDTKEVTLDLFNELDYDDLINKKDINHSWRWIPPGLYFYINFGTILHKPEDAPRTAPKQKIVPYLSDFEMAFTYNWVEARGFSGFEDDDEFTCNEDILLLKNNPKLAVHPTCYNKEGKLKKYIPARQYLRKLNDKPLGRHLYFNQARNLMLLGSRGGGKSWLSAIYVLLHEIITDGSKYYTEKALKDPPLNEIFLGSGIAAKSADLAAKIKIGMDNLPGIWKKGTPEQKPSPLFKHMAGTLAPNNIKNPWRHEYEKKIGGEYIKVGSGSNIKHGVFTTENPEATAGGRYSVIVIEEVGLTSNLLTVHGSSEATQMTDGTDKYGSSLYIGTGGNIDKIVEAEIIFRDPEGFNMLPFDDEWENAGKIGWFVPAYYMDRRYKDSEGNTLIEEAYKNYTDRRIQKKRAKSGSALDLEMMNYPLIPSEMFLNKTNNNYPTADLKHRLAELSTSPKILNSTWKGEFTINSEGKVEWKTVDKLPIREFPVKSTNTNNIEGCPEMFYPPQRDDSGDIASGRYIAALDPIDDDDNQDVTTSLQSFFIFDTFFDRIVFEYTGRTRYAKDFYEQCRRALIYYNARMLYENQKKGVFTYFDQKNSTYLMEDTPEALRDIDMQKISKTGNKSKGVYATPAINKWGREDLAPSWMSQQALNKPDGVTNAMILKSPALIREAILYNPNLNTDRISALGLLMIFREIKTKYTESSRRNQGIKTVDEDPFWSKNYGRKAIAN